MLKQSKKIYKRKRDEFYTQLSYIIDEMKYYKETFKNKVIYLPCDNPSDSQFYYYFFNKFKSLGLKKLIASFKSNSSLLGNQKGEKPYVLIIDKDKHENKKFLIEDGDFRNKELIPYWKEADIIITNPPFSLFKQVYQNIKYYNKKFILLGMLGNFSYFNFFKDFKNNLIRIGKSLKSKEIEFKVPSHYPVETEKFRIDIESNKYIRISGIRWFTNLDIEYPKRLELSRYFSEKDYQRYSNYDAINVDKVKDIPKNYKGIIGVPLTFVDKYNPNQFKIVSHLYGNDGDKLNINGVYPFHRILIRHKEV